MATNASFGTYQSNPKTNTVIDIQIGVFFDGTRNNRTNSRIAGKTEEINNYTHTTSKEDIEAYKKQLNNDEISDEESWNNDLSNVARSEKHYKQEKYIFSIYTEGIGTYDAKTDTMEGFALGAGKYGIPAKVKKASDEIYDKIKSMFSNSDDTVKIRLYFDVYGFSRGAAAARHFVAMINENVYANLKNITQINIVKKEVRFLGIYDTVSSYDPNMEIDKLLKEWDSLDLKEIILNLFYGRLPQSTLDALKVVWFSKRIAKTLKALIEHIQNKGFENDIEELKLNNLQEAKEILHFTASYEDEHRAFFALSSVARACGGNIREFGFHGAHSDIGGSYIHNAKEEVLIMNSFYKMVGDFLLKLDAPSVSNEEIFNNYLEKLTREGWFTGKNEAIVNNTYSEVILNLLILLNNLIYPIKVPPIFKRFYTLKSTRPKLSNRYSYVFLYLMVEESNLKTNNVFDYNKLQKEFVLPNGEEDKYYDVNLIEVKNMYSAYIKGDKNKQLVYNDDIEYYKIKFGGDIDAISKASRLSATEVRKKIEKNELVKKLRNKYFHYAACASIGYIPKYSYSRSKFDYSKFEINKNRLVIQK